MVKKFYCKECATNPAVKSAYSGRALAFLNGDDLVDLVCKHCCEPVEIVDKPCEEHDWYEVNALRFAERTAVIVWRKCTKCDAKQEGYAKVEWRNLEG